jgi:Derlin-2/3
MSLELVRLAIRRQVSSLHAVMCTADADCSSLKRDVHVGIESVYSMYLLVRHCKSLEQESFHGRSADLLWMLLLGAGTMLVTAPYTRLLLFSHSLSFMVMYVWARRNPYLRLTVFGIMNFTAPYWPWVNVLFTLLLGASPKANLLGIVVGHVYYFLEDVYPLMPGGRRYCEAPYLLRMLFNEHAQQRRGPDAETIRIVQPARQAVPGAAGADGQPPEGGQQGPEQPDLRQHPHDD